MKRMLLAISALGVLWSPHTAADDDKGQTRRQPFVIGNRDEPTRDQLNAFTKMFLHDVRQLGHDQDRLGGLRVFFDPRYLDTHDLRQGRFPVATIAVTSLRYQIADDNRTAACVVGANDSARELILLRFTVYDGKLYLAPPSPPHPTTGVFEPWILRMKLE